MVDFTDTPYLKELRATGKILDFNERCNLGYFS